MLASSDTNDSPVIDDQEVSPSTLRHQYFRPSATTNNRINFNPQPPKDFSRVYPGNPFLNNLATANPNDGQVEVQYVSGNRDRPAAVLENLKPKEIFVATNTESPQNRGGGGNLRIFFLNFIIN